MGSVASVPLDVAGKRTVRDDAVGWMAPALESALSPAPPETIMTPEDTLRRAGISNERQALYQRRMSSLLAGRG